jgi:hypothetical protein
MGADFLITALVIDRGRAPDFDAARAAIEAVTSAQIEEPEEFWDHDPATDAGLAEIRSRLRESLSDLEAALQRSRELASLELRGATVHLTGGLSTGEAPTELFESFSRLYAVPVVLAAAGFEVEPESPEGLNNFLRL